MPEFQQYRRSQIAELRPWIQGEDMTGISISAEDTKAGSPKEGDMIARNPKNHADQWLVAAAYFADNFEPCEQTPSPLLAGVSSEGVQITTKDIGFAIRDRLEDRQIEGLDGFSFVDFIDVSDADSPIIHTPDGHFRLQIIRIH